jgi:hypothetical protein
MVEQFASLDLSPRTACLDGIASCDAIVTIVGPRAGFKTPSGKYVIEEEWQYARKRPTPLHVFIQDGPLEPEAERIAREVSEYVHGRFRLMFKSPEELRQKIAQSLSTLALKMTPMTDTAALNETLATRPHGGYETQVRIAIQPVRKAELIDPLDLDSREFQDRLLQAGTGGPSPLFSLRARKSAKVKASSLQLEQSTESNSDADAWYAKAELATNGLFVAERTVTPSSRNSRGSSDSLGLALQASDLTEATSSLFQFMSAMYNQVDPYISCREFVYNVALVNLGHRYIYDAPPNASRGVPVRMSNSSENILGFESPRTIVREALDQREDEVRRVIALLRRRAQPEV